MAALAIFVFASKNIGRGCTLRRVMRIGFIGLAFSWLCLASAQDDLFSARLSTVPLDSRNRVQITGHGSASATLDGRELTVSGSFEGLQGAANVARLHLSPVIGVRGPAIFDLEVSGGIEGSIAATLRLSRGQTAALREGRLYIQIHSESAPEGNLWGWLFQ